VNYFKKGLQCVKRFEKRSSVKQPI